ncbi:hypothetical protein M1523_01445 [Patescibacteria group bacterium]|nr:hypothetical protein [Patescibacteria group bacterium]MCL5091555.1 hypothetical protein [Patescibacteria group bacterium]
MQKISKNTIIRYLKYLHERGESTDVVLRKLRSVDKFFAWAHARAYIKEELYKQTKREIDKAINHEIKTYEAKIKTQKADFDPGSRQALDNWGLRHYLGIALTLILMAFLGVGVYTRFFLKPTQPFAYPAVPTGPGTTAGTSRIISFQGRLTDSLGNPITATIGVEYRFYNAATGGTLLTSRLCNVSPDVDGIFSSLIGEDCGAALPASLFTENPDVYLAVKMQSEASEMTPRQHIANVGYAMNAETLQGLPAGTGTSSIPFINKDGNLLVAVANPGIRSTFTSAAFTISSASTATVQSAGTGDVILQATESGTLKFRTAGANDTYTRMTIDNYGNVGIGTTVPNALLDVRGKLKVADGTQGAGYFLTSDANGVASWVDQSSVAGPWTYSGAPNYYLYPDDYTNAKVGIGTTTASNLLTVHDPTGAGGTLVKIDTSASGTTGGYLELTAATRTVRLGADSLIGPHFGSTTTGGLMFLDNFSISPMLALSPNNGSIDLGTGSYRFGTLYNTNANVSTALGVGYDPSSLSGGVAGFNGNVGIGTSTPAGKLDVKSTQTSGTIALFGAPSAVSMAGTLTGVNLDLSTNYTATGYGVTGQSIALPAVTNTGTGTYAYKGLTIAGGNLVQNTGAGTDTWTGLDITMPPTLTQTTGSVTATGLKITGPTSVTGATRYGLIVDANAGNVGIGTTSPGQKLDVQGGVRLGAALGTNDILNTSAAGGAPSGSLYWGSRIVCDNSGNCAGVGSLPLSSITAATGTNTIDSGAYAQTWNWNSLASGNAFTLGSSSTAGAASGTSTVLNISRSGANANTAHTAYGLYSTVTNTNVTSGTNVAGYFSASGATTANYALYSAAGVNYFGGNVGVGTTSPGAALDIAGSLLVNNGGTIDTRAAGTLAIGGATQTGLTMGRSGATTTINGSSVIVNSLTGMIKGTTGTLSAVTGTTNYAAYWSDANTIAAEQYLATSRGGLGANVTAAGAGELLYSSGTTAYGHLAAGTSGQILKAAGAASPTWNTPGALTKTDDTNVTLTLGGSPTTSLVNAASITVGWSGQLAIARGGTNSTATPTAGGVAYGTGTAYAFTGAGTSGQFLISNGASAPSWTSTVPATSMKWNALTNPDGNLSLSMGAYTSTFTYNAATSTNNLFNLTDTASNTGTGYLLNVTTATGSTLKPFHVSVKGGTEALMVDANGNVGIGTTSPGAPLEVRKSTSGTVTKFLSSANANNADFIFSSGIAGNVNSGQVNLYLADRESNKWGIRMNFTTPNLTFEDIANSKTPFTIETNTPSNTLYLKSTGNVGIGTTGPGSKLDVVGQINIANAGGDAIHIGNNQFIKMANTGGTQKLLLGISSNDETYLRGATVLHLQANDGGQEVTILNSGNVGIGTTGPGYKLEVAGDIYTNSRIAIGTAPVGGAGTLVTNSYALIRGIYAGYNSTTSLGNVNDGEMIQFGGASATDLVLKKNSGNVGIGTTGPGYKLAIGDFVDGNNYAISVQAGNGEKASLKLFDYSTNYGFTIENDGTLPAGEGGLNIIRHNNSAAGISAVYINRTSGNVGIGTTNPLAKLHVEGSCVTGDTLLPIRRRRRKKKNNPDTAGDPNDWEWEYLYCRIDEVLPGDEVLSLNESIGRVEWHQIKNRMDMGVRDIYEIVTKTGRHIKTTSNHPYLALIEKPGKEELAIKNPVNTGSGIKNVDYKRLTNQPKFP